MAGQPQAFYCLWQEEGIREKLFDLLPKEDICAVRLANSACCNLVTKRLFLRTTVSFTANTFTKPHRVQALSRIGHHIEHLTFYLAHSDATFLPPLIHPSSGKEINFLYTPHTSMASVLSRPKYGHSELGEILTQQYPPLFHAATNVPSFINAMRHIPNMRHLTIRCPGQDPQERYRRDIVDYALISLRISLERAPLDRLMKLSLSGVHPSAFNYLRHVPGFGCRPSAGRRWKQIRKLYVSVESWDFYGPSPGLDHLKIIDDYIRAFAPNLEKFSFTWLGRRGPCPLALSGDPLFAPPRSSRKLFNEVTSPMSPLPPAPCRTPIRFPRLRYLTVRNATMSAPQLRDLVATHEGTVREFDFENVALLGGGSWDDALAPLMDQNSDHHGSDVWSRHSLGSGGNASEAESLRTTASAASASSGDLPSPSAAVAAASRELLDLDVEGLESYLGLSGELPPPPAAKLSEAGIDDNNDDQDNDDDDDDDLASDIAAAREASLSFSTKLKKKRVRRRKRTHLKDDASSNAAAEDSEATAAAERRHGSSSSSSSSSSSLKHEQSTETVHSSRSHSRSRSSSRHHHHHRPRHHRKPSTEEIPLPTPPRSPPRSPPRRPSLGSTTTTTSSGRSAYASTSASIATSTTDPDDVFRPRTPAPLPLNISAPILCAEPLPALLQPTVYDPTNPTGADPADEGLSGVQRNLELEEAQRRLAEDAEARTSALRKAKEAVLMKLSREFHRRLGKEVASSSAPGGRCAGPAIGGRSGGGSGGVAGARRLFGERLFGESLVSVVPDHRSMESTSSVLVPLMFSRG